MVSLVYMSLYTCVMNTKFAPAALHNRKKEIWNETLILDWIYTKENRSIEPVHGSKGINGYMDLSFKSLICP